MPIANTNGIQLYYEVHGKGEPLVLISGLGGDGLSVWEKVLNTFSRAYQVILFDNRGIGRSSCPETPFTIEDMADDLKGLLDHLDISSAHIAGYSMGGIIAQAFAIKYPAAVNRLILCGTYAKMNNQILLMMDAITEVYAKDPSPQALYDLIFPLLFDRNYYQNQQDPEKLSQLPEVEYPQPPYSYLNQYQALRQFDSSKKLHKIKAKTLVIGARNDFFATPSDLKILSDKILNSRLCIMENTGHLFSLYKPDEFSKEILSFLRE